MNCGAGQIHHLCQLIRDFEKKIEKKKLNITETLDFSLFELKKWLILYSCLD